MCDEDERWKTAGNMGGDEVRLSNSLFAVRRSDTANNEKKDV